MKKTKKKKLTAEERSSAKLKRDHIRAVRSTFSNAGFLRVQELAEKNIEFMGQKGEFDDVFIHENVLLLVEYTTTSSSGAISDHIKHKKILFDRVKDNQSDFIEQMSQKFPAFGARVGSPYHIDSLILRIVYCSRFAFDEAVKGVVDSVEYLDFPVLKYFEKIAATIYVSARHELLNFFGVDISKVGKQGVITSAFSSQIYHGSILPESASGFPKGYKVVSFYADAASLLERAYVLRRKGWRSSQSAYQRMLLPKKVEAIRNSIRNGGHVAINNIIATLPSEVHPVDSEEKTIDIAKLKETMPVRITLPMKANCVGLIDGQHRLYSYYQTSKDDQTIATYRHRQNLLVTGIIYPAETKLNPAETERFEAQLFLSINSNQSSASSELRQEIAVLLNPFSLTAISKKVVERLSASGPLASHMELYFYDKGKLKTSSIVNFGLGPLLKLSGPDSMFSVFAHPEKQHLLENKSEAALEDYIQFSVSTINKFLNAVRSNTESERWTAQRSHSNRLITVTNINAFLITIRKLIENGKSLDFETLKIALDGFAQFDTTGYGSSRYNLMAEKIYSTYFK